MSNRPKLVTLQRKAQRRAFLAMWDAPPIAAPGSLAADMVKRDTGARRYPMGRI